MTDDKGKAVAAAAIAAAANDYISPEWQRRWSEAVQFDRALASTAQAAMIAAAYAWGVDSAVSSMEHLTACVRSEAGHYKCVSARVLGIE